MTSNYVVSEFSLCNRASYFVASSGTSVAKCFLVSNLSEIDLTSMIQVGVDEFWQCCSSLSLNLPIKLITLSVCASLVSLSQGFCCISIHHMAFSERDALVRMSVWKHRHTYTLLWKHKSTHTRAFSIPLLIWSLQILNWCQSAPALSAPFKERMMGMQVECVCLYMCVPYPSCSSSPLLIPHYVNGVFFLLSSAGQSWEERRPANEKVMTCRPLS